MAATQFGAEVKAGAGSLLGITNAADYVLVSITANDTQEERIEVEDANGVVVTIVQPYNVPVYNARVLCKFGANPVGDFPIGQNVVVGSDKYEVASAPVVRTKNSHEVTIKLIKWNLAVVV